MSAYDNIFPEDTSTAAIFVQVMRNQLSPVWVNNVPILVTINETAPLGYIVSSAISAVDPDNVCRRIRLDYLKFSGLVLPSRIYECDLGFRNQGTLLWLKT